MPGLLKNKEVKNAGWMIGGKMMQMIISLVVGVLTARYLGPSNYGLINYAATYVAFFSSLCSLGINAVIIKDFNDHPDDQGVAIGTTIGLRLISAFFSVITIFAAVSLIDYGEKTTMAVVMLSSMSLLFHIFDVLNPWFQYRYEAKTTATASLLAYFVVAVYKTILLVTGKSVYWFAFSTSVDYVVLAAFLLIAYSRKKGPSFRFSWAKGRELLKRSYPYILSGMMTAVYAQTDKLMLKQMLANAEVGYYSTATAICGMWTFVLAAIIDAVFPTIYRVYNINKADFEKKNRQLYAIVIYISIAASLFFVLFGSTIISILYGETYLPAASTLKILTFGTVFSYLGVARHAWVICENMQKHLTVISLSAAILNVILNYFMIPVLGTAGAALSSVVAQFLTCCIVPLFIRGMRPNVKLMVEAAFLQNVFNIKEKGQCCEEVEFAKEKKSY